MMIRRITRTAAGQMARSGFTLAELLAVVAILAILAGVAIPTYITLIGNQRVKIAKTECKKFASMLKNFANDHMDEFPQTSGFPAMNGDLGILVEAGMLTQLPLDPWQRHYYYELAQSQTGFYEPIVYSDGPDGVNKISSIQQ
jgi:prepilin-type N-terminal cleavage/methylation domain-containing protein